jgi:hypothetical protein
LKNILYNNCSPQQLIHTPGAVYVQHFRETKHQFDFDNPKVLQLELHYQLQRRKLIEGIYIKMSKEKPATSKQAQK